MFGTVEKDDIVDIVDVMIAIVEEDGMVAMVDAMVVMVNRLVGIVEEDGIVDVVDAMVCMVEEDVGIVGVTFGVLTGTVVEFTGVEVKIVNGDLVSTCTFAGVSNEKEWGTYRWWVS